MGAIPVAATVAVVAGLALSALALALVSPVAVMVVVAATVAVSPSCRRPSCCLYTGSLYMDEPRHFAIL